MRHWRSLNPVSLLLLPLAGLFWLAVSLRRWLYRHALPAILSTRGAGGGGGKHHRRRHRQDAARHCPGQSVATARFPARGGEPGTRRDAHSAPQLVTGQSDPAGVGGRTGIDCLENRRSGGSGAGSGGGSPNAVGSQPRRRRDSVGRRSAALSPGPQPRTGGGRWILRLGQRPVIACRAATGAGAAPAGCGCSDHHAQARRGSTFQRRPSTDHGSQAWSRKTLPADQ